MSQPSSRTKVLVAIGLLAGLVAAVFVWISRDRSHATEVIDRVQRSEPGALHEPSPLADVARAAPPRAQIAVETETKATSSAPAVPDENDQPCWLLVFDLDSNQPLEHVKITAELGIDQAISFTDEHGLARIEGLKTQMRLLQLDHFGYSSIFLDTEAGHETAQRAWRIPMSRTATLIAHVRSATGAAVPDVQVTLESVGFESRNRHLTRLDALSQGTITIDSMTDSSGTVKIALLAASIPFQATVFQPRPWSPPERIVLDPGEVREVEWTLSGGCLLRGILLDQREQPVVRRRIWMTGAITDDPFYFHRSLGGNVHSTTTDENGRFEFVGVDPASWWIGPEPTSSDVEATDRARVDPALDVAPLAQLVRIEEGQASLDVTLHVDRGLYIRGRVLDAGGAPAVDAHILAAEPEQRVHAEGKTDGADGSFAIGPLARGTYTLTASRSFRDADSESVFANAGESDIVLRLRAGAEISGQVIGEDGAGVSASMSVRDRESDPSRGRSMHTDQNGRFAIRGLSAGAFDVAATSEDGRIGLLQRVGVAEGAKVRDVIVRVTHGGRVRVRHTGPETSVELEMLQNGALFATGGAMRNMPSERVVPAGTVVIRARYQEGDRRTIERTVSVAAGETVEVVLEAGAR